MWSLRHSLADEFDSLLVITFVGDTRILAMNAEDELEEAELPGFDTDVQVMCTPMLTQHACNLQGASGA